MGWKSSDIITFIIFAALFTLFFLSGIIIGPLVKTNEPGGGKIYQIVYNYFPFISFIFIIIGAAIFARDSIWKGTLLGTLLIFPALIIISINSIKLWGNPFGFGSGGIGPFMFVIVIIPALIISLIVSFISHKFWGH